MGGVEKTVKVIGREVFGKLLVVLAFGGLAVGSSLPTTDRDDLVDLVSGGGCFIIQWNS